jgi:hypothetical protein
MVVIRKICPMFKAPSDNPMKTVIPNIAMSAVLIQTFNAVNMVSVIKFI